MCASFGTALIPPTVYYSKVALELGRIILRGQKMSPPYVLPAELHLHCLARGRESTNTHISNSSVSHFQSHLQPVIEVVRTPSQLQKYTSSTPGRMLSSVRNMTGTQAAAVGVVIAEVIGFFTVGEMIGKMKIVGYRMAGPGQHEQKTTDVMVDI